MPTSSSHSPVRIPAAPASSREARTGKKRSGTPTVPPMMATARSCWRNFIDADDTHMTASRTTPMARAMNMDFLQQWLGGTDAGALRELLADLGKDLGA